MTFKELQGLFFVAGIFLIAFASTMLMPAVVEFWTGGPDGATFVIISLITAFSGGLFIISNDHKEFVLTRKQTFMLTAISWALLCFFGALPFIMSSQVHMSLSDAIFETVSGITTTGSTVLSGLDGMNKGILLWRAILQWIGGVGIVVMAVAILPFLKVGGMQLFQTESSDRSDKVAPKVAQIAARLAFAYIFLTILCAFSYYYFSDMNSFEALVHSFTTLSTGGYSTADASLGAFNHGAQWVAIVFMFLGGLPFLLWVRIFQGKLKAFARDSQVQFYVSLVSIIVSLVCFYLVSTGRITSFIDAFRNAAFMVLTLVTTTGYGAADEVAGHYTNWGAFVVTLVFFLTFVGGCTGSTAGGFKIFRIQMSFAFAYRQLRQMIKPHGVFSIEFNKKIVSDDAMSSILLFSVAWILTVAITTLLLGFLGLDLITAFTGASTAIANVGPGLGDIIGPDGNFSTLPTAAKWILSLAMLLGRLEIMTLLVLLVPDFWKH
ncbi:MAG: TrkH family potassium uptake protein [Alphaproteobacteria bacterium]